MSKVMQMVDSREGEPLATVPLRLVIFFSSNPDMALSSVEISNKFLLDRDNVSNRLHHLVNAGILTKTTRKATRGKGHATNFYAAGPVILKELGYDE